MELPNSLFTTVARAAKSDAYIAPDELLNKLKKQNTSSQPSSFWGRNELVWIANSFQNIVKYIDYYHWGKTDKTSPVAEVLLWGHFRRCGVFSKISLLATCDGADSPSS